jgi:hypothetical protein
MIGKQVVTAPNGERWEVGRRWLNEPRRRLWRPRRRRSADDAGEAASWANPASIDVGDDLLLGVGLALAVALVVVLFAFVLLPLLGLALELALLLGVFASGLFGRVVLGRPWTIEAVSLDDSQQRVRFAVKGWRGSRRAIAALADAIATTGPPAALADATPVASG